MTVCLDRETNSPLFEDKEQDMAGSDTDGTSNKVD